MDNSHDISVLNGLIETTLDSMKGYNEACEDSETSRSAFFSSMAQERSQVASRLQSQVSSLGGDPEDVSSFSAAAHRAFMGLKELVTSNDEKAIVEEVERGEDYIKSRYEDALQDGDLSPPSRQLVQECFQSVQQGHDRMSQLKHQMEG